MIPRPSLSYYWNMITMKVLTILLLVLLLASVSFASDKSGAASGATSTRPPNGWDGTVFRYTRPTAMVVEETTPTPEQVEWRSRPAPMKTGQVEPQRSDKPAKPVMVAGMDVVRLRFRNLDGEDVPVLLVTPAGKKGPFPVAVALHGL